PLSISQLTIRDIILIGRLPANAARELCTSGFRCGRHDRSPHTNRAMTNLRKSGKEDYLCSPPQHVRRALAMCYPGLAGGTLRGRPPPSIQNDLSHSLISQGFLPESDTNRRFRRTFRNKSFFGASDTTADQRARSSCLPPPHPNARLGILGHARAH